MDNTSKIESIAADLHMLAAPFRFLFAAVKVMLFTLSFPLLCGLVLLQYAVGKIDPLHRYMEVVQAHRIPLAVYPFVVLGALLLLAVTMLLVVARDLGGLADVSSPRSALGHCTLCTRQHRLVHRGQGSLPSQGRRKNKRLVEPSHRVHGSLHGGAVRIGVPRFPAASDAPVLRDRGCFQPDPALPLVPWTQAESVTSDAAKV